MRACARLKRKPCQGVLARREMAGCPHWLETCRVGVTGRVKLALLGRVTLRVNVAEVS